MTRRRRGMFEWIFTRGKNFEDPVEQDTNYLTDYDGRTGQRKEDDEVFSGKEGAKGSEADEKTADALAKDRSQSQRPRRPFPQNLHFISQSILSEQLREEIWRRVRVDGKSIRNVSVELGVEMRRVGAVVRLMEIQNQWRAEVSSHSLLSRILPLLGMNIQIRLVLHTSVMVIYQNKLQLSDSKSNKISPNPLDDSLRRHADDAAL